MSAGSLLEDAARKADAPAVITYLQCCSSTWRRALASGDMDTLVTLCAIVARFPEHAALCEYVFHAIQSRTHDWGYELLSRVPNDVVEMIVGMVNAPEANTEIKRAGVRVLGSLASHPLCASIVSAIADAMLAHSDCSGIQCTGCWSMMCLADYSRVVRELIRTGKGIEALVKTPRPEAGALFEAIRRLSQDGADSQTQLAAAGVIESIIGRLSFALSTFDMYSARFPWRSALAALNDVIIFHRANATRFVAAGGIPIVASLMHAWSTTSSIMIGACSVLACLSRDQYTPDDHDPVLIRAVGHDDDDVRLTVKRTLAFARLWPSFYEGPCTEQGLYNILLCRNAVLSMNDNECLATSIVAPWNHDAHKYFPADIRAAIVTVLVLARSDHAHTRMRSGGLWRVPGPVLNCLLNAIAWPAYGF